MKLTVRQVAADIKVRFTVHAARGTRDIFRKLNGIDPVQALLEIDLLASQVDTAKLRFTVDIIDRIAKLATSPQNIKSNPKDFQAVERAVGASYAALSDIYCEPSSWIEDHTKYASGVVAARLEAINSLQSQFVELTLRPVSSLKDADSGGFLRWFSTTAEDLAFDIERDFDQSVRGPIQNLIETLAAGDWASSFDAIGVVQHYLHRFPLRELHFVTGTGHQLDQSEIDAATSLLQVALRALPEPLLQLGKATIHLVGIIQSLNKRKGDFYRGVLPDTAAAPWVVGRWDSAEGGRQVVTMVNPYAIAGQVKQVVILPDGLDWLEQRITEMVKICSDLKKTISERERVDWIRAHGSDQLQRQVLENFTWARSYNLELYQHWSAPIQSELQALVAKPILLFGNVDVDILPRHSPTNEAFSIRDVCAEAGAEAEIIFCKRLKDIPEPGVEAVRIRPPGPLAEHWILVGPLALAESVDRQQKKKSANKV